MALMGTLNTSLELQERCFQNSSLCLQFFLLPGNSVKILALKKIQEGLGTVKNTLTEKFSPLLNSELKRLKRSFTYFT